MKKIQEKIEECVSTICSELTNNQELLSHIAENLLKISDTESDDVTHDSALEEIYQKVPCLKSSDYTETEEAIKELAHLLNASSHRLVKDEVERKVKNGAKAVDAMIEVASEVKNNVANIFKQHDIALSTESPKIKTTYDYKRKYSEAFTSDLSQVEKLEQQRITRRCIEFIAQDPDVAEKFKQKYGPDELNKLKNFSSVKQQ